MFAASETMKRFCCLEEWHLVQPCSGLARAQVGQPGWLQSGLWAGLVHHVGQCDLLTKVYVRNMKNKKKIVLIMWKEATSTGAQHRHWWMWVYSLQGPRAYKTEPWFERSLSNLWDSWGQKGFFHWSALLSQETSDKSQSSTNWRLLDDCVQGSCSQHVMNQSLSFAHCEVFRHARHLWHHQPTFFPTSNLSYLASAQYLCCFGK